MSDTETTSLLRYVHGRGGGIYITPMPVVGYDNPWVVNVKLAATHEGVGGSLWLDFDPDTARAAAAQLIAAADKCEGVGE